MVMIFYIGIIILCFKGEGKTNDLHLRYESALLVMFLLTDANK